MDGDGRPYQDYINEIPDGSTSRGEDASRVDAAPEPEGLCSEAGVTAISVLFTNQTGRSGRLVWANEACVLTQYAEIGAGQSYTQQTFVGHAWRLLAVDNDALLDQVRIADGQTEVDFQ